MRIFSGIQPTGGLHVGNYFGAVRSWVRLQDAADAERFYAVVDLHALTGRPDPRELSRRTLETAAELLACGIDPERSTLFVQSHVPEHGELTWILSCFTGAGELTRMTQYKERIARGEAASAGLLAYPVLQAADVLLYGACRVPVGEDQLQHLELARSIARRFHRETGREVFPHIEPVLPEVSRVFSLSDPSRKMSKSLGERHALALMDPPEVRWKKIRQAVTDPGGAGGPGPGVANLMALLRASAPEEVTRQCAARLESGQLPYRELKETLDAHLGALLDPIQRRRRALADESVREILARGAERARAAAAETMERVRLAVGVGEGSLAGGSNPSV